MRPLLCALAFVACSRADQRQVPAPPPSASASAAPLSAWPAWLESKDAAEKLIAERTRRATVREPSVTSESLRASLLAAAERNTLTAGLEAIAPSLGAATDRERSFVLFGSFHDAAPQIALFRKLTGPLGFGPTDVALEQLHAPGRWQNLEPGMQQGDGAVLDAFAKGADRAALDALVASQRDHDYAAWKYDYLEELPALAASVRASGVRLHGCDLPAVLQARVKHFGDAALAGLRELHCALALEQLPKGRKVAVLWGARHVESDGFPRFLPPDAAVTRVLLFGGRPAGEGEEARLSEGLRLGEPVLFPLEGLGRYALVLAEGALAARVDRVRTEVVAGDEPHLGKLLLTSETELELRVAGKHTRVGPKRVELALGPGAHAFLAQAPGKLAIAGAVPMPEHGFVELELDPKAGSLRLVVHRAR